MQYNQTVKRARTAETDSDASDVQEALQTISKRLNGYQSDGGFVVDQPSESDLENELMAAAEESEDEFDDNESETSDGSEVEAALEQELQAEEEAEELEKELEKELDQAAEEEEDDEDDEEPSTDDELEQMETDEE